MSTANDVTAGGWQADDYAQNARFVADLAGDLIEWLAPQPGERILDLGCGDGALSARIAESGAAVVGVDGSSDMVTATRSRGLDAVEGDGQRLAASNALGGLFDAVFSNAALHWMSRDPQAVVDAVSARLKPGGRFVAEMGGAGNITPLHAALRDEVSARGRDPDTLDPWYFPSERDYGRRLSAAGFEIDRIELFERPTPLPGDIADWLTTLARPFVTAFTAGAERASYIAAVRGRLGPRLKQTDGTWVLPYVRLRFRAYKPA